MREIVKVFVGWILGLIEKEELRMRKAIVFTIALTIVAFVAGEASATKLTEEQVRTVCGKELKDNGKGDIGCNKECGEKKRCDYSCGGPEGKGCRGYVMMELPPELIPCAPGGSTTKPPVK